MAPQRLTAVVAEGWWQLRHPAAPTQATTDVEARFLAVAAANAVAPNELDAFWQGYAGGEVLVAALEAAAALPVGVTRTNLLLVLWSLDLAHPAMAGVRVHANGPVDPFLVEGAVLHQVVGGSSLPVGPVDVDGRTPPCASPSVLVPC